jgi:thiamine kinase-like enzyme
MLILLGRGVGHVEVADHRTTTLILGDLNHEELVRALPIWEGRIEMRPLLGGMTNRNYLVRDARKNAVVRIGGDIPMHGIMRFNELAASCAAAMAGLSPRVLFAKTGVLVLEHIAGRSFSASDVRTEFERCVTLVKRAHRDLHLYLRGPTLAFNVFHILRDYAHTLREGDCRLMSELPRFLAATDVLEKAVGSVQLIFGHNDLLAANFIDDGNRLWLIDWEYAGWNTPLFDLAGLSSNNDFSLAETETLLESYFETPANDQIRYRFDAIVCASLLREALWSMVCEIHSDIEFDFVAYTNENLQRFENAWHKFLGWGGR